MTTERVPLAALAGTWEGDSGIDTAYSNSLGEVIETTYRERAEFNIALDADGVFSYAESTILRLRALGRELDHSDRNTLRRITA